MKITALIDRLQEMAFKYGTGLDVRLLIDFGPQWEAPCQELAYSELRKTVYLMYEDDRQDRDDAGKGEG